MKSPRESDSVNKVWKHITQIGQVVNGHSSNISTLALSVKRIGERNKLGYDLYPFKIYVLPDQFRGFDPDGWHKVRVRGGFVFTDNVTTSSYVLGTDMFQNYAYQNTFPMTASYDITLPTDSNSNPIWFWIEKTPSASVSSYNLRYGNNPIVSSLGNPTPWSTFPAQNAAYIPVGLVDAYTSASSYQLLIRQFLETDVLSSGGAGLIWKGEYTESSSYAVNDVTRVNCQLSYSFNFTSGSAGHPQGSAGLFICSLAVPASSSRNIYNAYYPIYPYIPSSSIQTVTVGTSSYIANQTFWTAMAPMYPAMSCDASGNNLNTFNNGEIVGKTFDLTTLPYSP
jgi:hypothetical protein